jgi:DNA-binding LacI/PurR family transcriptional regulator
VFFVALFHARLDALVQITPPTALILDEVPLFLAAQRFLAENGIRVPEDVSLICTDTSQDFAWCRRTVAHIHWDSLAVVRRVVRWAANVSRGKEDLRQTLTAAKFVAGGPIGPAKMGGTEDGR